VAKVCGGIAIAASGATSSIASAARVRYDQIELLFMDEAPVAMERIADMASLLGQRRPPPRRRPTPPRTPATTATRRPTARVERDPTAPPTIYRCRRTTNVLDAPRSRPHRRRPEL
jgi:hypothetical protein